MGVNRQKKEDLVKMLGEKMKQAKSFVFIDYSGMGVKQQEDLKKRLKTEESDMVVAKNTLVKLAVRASGFKFDEVDSTLTGQTAVVFGMEDPISPIQILGKFAREFDIPKFRAGMVEGSFQDKDAVVKISTLPGKEILQSQALAYLSSPLYSFVSILSSKMQSLVYILEQASEKGGEK